METPAGATDARKGLRRRLGAFTLMGMVVGCTPPDPAVVLEQNIAACSTGSFPEQRIAACSAVASDADATPAQRAAALIQRGMDRAEQQQYTRAVADFGRALRLDPSNTDALSERGAVHQQRGAYEAALSDFEAALALDPYNSIAAYRRDQALQGRGDSVRQQLAQLTEMLARDPNNAEALNNRCWLLAVNDGDLNAALADCDAALRIAPQSSNTLDSRGLVRLKRGEFAAALGDYEAALALEPREGHYLYGRGLARLRLGDVQAGEADLAAAELLRPGVGAAYASYGYIPTAPAAAAGSQPLSQAAGNAKP